MALTLGFTEYRTLLIVLFRTREARDGTWVVCFSPSKSPSDPLRHKGRILAPRRRPQSQPPQRTALETPMSCRARRRPPKRPSRASAFLNSCRALTHSLSGIFSLGTQVVGINLNSGPTALSGQSASSLLPPLFSLRCNSVKCSSGTVFFFLTVGFSLSSMSFLFSSER